MEKEKAEKRESGKARKIVGFVALGLVAAFFVYCAVVMIVRVAGATDAKRWSAVPRFMAEFGVSCLLALPCLDVALGIFSWRKNKAARAAGIVLRVAVCCVCLAFVGMVLAVDITGTITDEEPVETVCVLGLAVNGDEIEKDLEHRLDRALEYKAQHPDVTVIVTGGNSEDADKTEAAYMRRYLLSHGFDTTRGALVEEAQAKTTVQNFQYVAELVDKDKPLAVVTSNTHIFRATAIAQKQGYAKIVRVPAKSEPATYLENLTWDTICAIMM